MNIIGSRKIWLAISGTMVFLSLLAYAFWGLKLGIDFTGGSLLEVSFTGARPSNAQVQEKLQSLDLGAISLQAVDDKFLLMRFKNVDEPTHNKIIEILNNEFGGPDKQVKEDRFESIGPVIGQELRQKAIYAIIFVLIVIMLYVAFAFRQVSWPVQSWKYGLIAVIALFHDILGVVGLFALLGKFSGIEVNAPFVAVLLTVLGYSVNDTIIVFDRVRENLAKSDLTFAEVVNSSINQTIARSINTTATTLAALVAVYLFGGESIKSFALALLWGIFLGGYSSIFVASPLLVVWYNWDRKRRAA